MIFQIKRLYFYRFLDIGFINSDISRERNFTGFMDAKYEVKPNIKLGVPFHQIVLYFTINALVVFFIASLNAEEGRFGHWLFYGYFWSFPVALIVYVFLILTRAGKAPKDDSDDWATDITSASWGEAGGIIAKDIVERHIEGKKLGYDIKPVGFLPPSIFLYPYLILIGIAIVWGIQVETKINSNGNPTYHGDPVENATNLMMLFAVSFTIVTFLVLYTFRKLLTLPGRGKIAERKIKEGYRAHDFGDDSDIDKILK
jgi:hypothetical protein